LQAVGESIEDYAFALEDGSQGETGSFGVVRCVWTCRETVLLVVPQRVAM
jgi:hypothetical protein